MPQAKLISSLSFLPSKGRCQNDGAGFFIVMPSNRMRGNGHKVEHKKFHTNMRKICESDRALETAAQTGCEVSFPGDIENLPGHTSELCILGDPA